MLENETVSKRGGAREGAGRPTKADESEIQRRLNPMDDLALDALKKGLSSRNTYPFVKLFMEYRFGKPKEQKSIDLTSGGKAFTLKDLFEFEDDTQG